MLFGWWWLLMLIFLFIVVLDYIYYADAGNTKIVFLNFSIIVFFFFLFMFSNFDFSTVFFYSLNLKILWFWNISITYGIDSLSLVFLLLTAFIFVICALVAWNSIKFKINLFFILLLLLEFFILNVFISFDLLFFYFWFESSLLPIFFIILIWGNNSRKINAAFYLVMYTFVFSILFFFSIIFLHYFVGTTNVFVLTYFIEINEYYQKIFFIFFFFAFAVKLPIFPLHIWLPEAHVEAPTVGSIILASLLLKLGYYGALRFFMQFFLSAILYFKPILAVIRIISCTYSSLIALSQFDIKKLIAYSSVAHMSLSLLGLFSCNLYGILGSFILAVGHTFVSTALFFLVGSLYDRYHTRIADYFFGLGRYLPFYSTMFFNFLISNFGFPVSLNFVGEFLILVGIGDWNLIILIFLIFYSVLSVAYNLFLYTRIFHGAPKVFLALDLLKLEILILVPLLLSNFFLCFFPSFLIKLILPALILF